MLKLECIGLYRSKAEHSPRRDRTRIGNPETLDQCQGFCRSVDRAIGTFGQAAGTGRSSHGQLSRKAGGPWKPEWWQLTILTLIISVVPAA
jgi:hypothetical protein